MMEEVVGLCCGMCKSIAGDDSVGVVLSWCCVIGGFEGASVVVVVVSIVIVLGRSSG